VRGKGQRPTGPDLTNYFYFAAAVPTLSFRTSDEISTYRDWGGTNASKGFGPTANIEPEDEWTQHFVPFRSFGQRTPAFEPDRLTNLQFLTRVMPFDFWVDDIAFYSGVANCCLPGCGEEITFADPNLAYRVALSVGDPIQLGTHAVSCETICGVSGLSATYGPLESLGGLECAAPLTAASFTGSSLTDVSPLAGLPHVAALDLSTNSLVDVSALASLARLHSLDLSKNPVTSLDALESAPRLAFLRANGAALSEVNLDGPFPALEWLEINTNPLTSLSLAELPGLKFVDASGGKLTSVALALPGLQTLRLATNTLSSLELDTPALAELDVRGNLLKNLDAVRGARSLTALFVDENPLVDVSALAELPDLNTLSLVHTPIDSAALGAIRGGPLGYLGLSGDRIDDISALEAVAFGPQANGLPLVIALDGTRVTDLSPLARNPTVVAGTLYLAGTPLDCTAQAENIAILAARSVTILGPCAPPSP
jgi:hypothetical protein